MVTMPVSIEDQLGIGSEPRELIIGKSFHKLLASSSNSSTSGASSKKGKNNHHHQGSSTSQQSSSSTPSNGNSFHSLRYDFKPASVDVSKMARMEFSQNNDKVKVTVPNVEASNQPETIFTGNKKPHLKECVLIIDHETGEITLERLTHSINVKKTRVEGSSKSQQQLQRPSTPSSFSPSCSSSGQTSSSGSKPSKPAPNVSPPKDFNGHHHLPVPGHQQLNGKPSSSSSSVAKTVPIPSPLSQPNNAKSAGDGGGGGNNGTSVLSEASSSEDESDSSSSSSGSSSSSDEDDEIRKVEADLCPKINGTSVTASAAAHNNYSGDVMMSSSDEEEEEQMNGLRQYESQMPKEYRSIDTSKAQKLDRNMDTRHLQSSSHFSSSTSGYNRQQVGNKDPLSMPKFSDLKGDLHLSESGSDSD